MYLSGFLLLLLSGIASHPPVVVAVASFPYPQASHIKTCMDMDGHYGRTLAYEHSFTIWYSYPALGFPLALPQKGYFVGG